MSCAFRQVPVTVWAAYGGCVILERGHFGRMGAGRIPARRRAGESFTFAKRRDRRRHEFFAHPSDQCFAVC